MRWRPSAGRRHTGQPLRAATAPAAHAWQKAAWKQGDSAAATSASMHTTHTGRPPMQRSISSASSLRRMSTERG